VDDNSLTGTIPSDLGQLSMCNQLSIANNTLTGSIPNELCGVGSAHEEGGVLQVAGNNLTGGASVNESCAEIVF